ncbi:hypothetical protein CDO87_16815 [Sagittula sp. P11]|jgi:uncharacterized tellurite resistance protein B-like protein|uniref:tellurite resistance TerB family protein n=1 Tax=unclassified Sagittula TaxID=2624628 RepID=UPI000C2D0B66|nr:TerB family tellurite resistance protein [Sagittula sp. P11]AUC54733.1 hypothetical protein CDO87_16815 [Sagittula sp. P11]
MFERLTTFFRSKPATPEPLPELDAKYALGTLLVRVAQADSAYLFEEIEQIDRTLAEWNDLNPVEAAKMRAMCERLAHTIADDAELAGLIRNHVDYAHRLEAVQALWRVARSDGITDTREQALVDLVETHLGIERTDSEEARLASVIP